MMLLNMQISSQALRFRVSFHKHVYPLFITFILTFFFHSYQFFYSLLFLYRLSYAPLISFPHAERESETWRPRSVQHFARVWIVVHPRFKEKNNKKEVRSSGNVHKKILFRKKSIKSRMLRYFNFDKNDLVGEFLRCAAIKIVLK